MARQNISVRPVLSQLAQSEDRRPAPDNVGCMRIDDLVIKNMEARSKPASPDHTIQVEVDATNLTLNNLVCAAPPPRRGPGPVAACRELREGQSGEIFTRPTSMRAELMNSDGDSILCELKSTTYGCFVIV
ncbi:hypothetical protein ACQY0O_005794 [Thecaphora frezii]